MKHPLRIGYIWQYESRAFSSLSATKLHINAIVRGLQNRGHFVRTITMIEGQPHWSDDLISWNPVETVSRPRAFRDSESVLRGIQSRLNLPYLNIFDSLHFSDACAAVLADFDVLYERFWMFASGGYFLSRKLGAPIIYEVNGDLVEEYNQQGLSLSRIQWAGIHRLNRHMFENAGKVVMVSHTLRENYIGRLGSNGRNVVTIENGAATELFTDIDSESIKYIQTQYQLNKGIVTIFVGTFKPWHGLDLLIRAFCRVVATQPDAQLLLVGDGPLRTHLEGQVAQLDLENQVIFTGMVQHNQVPKFLGVAEIAVVNPEFTNATAAQSPLKLFEYMAAGKAIIAPRIPNFEDIIDDGQNGILVSPNDPEALSKAILMLMEDGKLRNRLGEAAKERAFKRYSWDRTVSEIESIMYDLVGEESFPSQRLSE